MSELDAFRTEVREWLAENCPDGVRRSHGAPTDVVWGGRQAKFYHEDAKVWLDRMAARGWKLWDALTDRLEADGVLDRYDLVFIDTPPALGYLTINGLAASDILLVPLGASFLEFDSTGRFFDMLHSTFASIEEGENIAARALGREEMHFQWDAVRAVVLTGHGGLDKLVYREDLPFLEFADIDKVRQGELVFAIGSPMAADVPMAWWTVMLHHIIKGTDSVPPPMPTRLDTIPMTLPMPNMAARPGICRDAFGFLLVRN